MDTALSMESSHPLVTIIILNWNRKKCLKETLESLSDITYDNYEVVVVDNASTDRSQEMVRNYFPKYKLINLPTNVGCEQGFNVGIVNAQGEILVFLDNDAFLESNAIDQFVAVFSRQPSTGIIDPKILNFYTNEIMYQTGVRPSENIFTGCAFAITREVIDKIGLRPAEYFIYASEPEISMRVIDAGYKIVTDHSIVAYHKESPDMRLSP